MRPVEALSNWSVRRPWTIIALALALTGVGLWLSVTRFAINTDTARLISPDIGWRQTEIAYDQAFPERTELIVVVLDAANPETADKAADELAADLKRHPTVFSHVERPDGGAFFAHNGLLLLPRAELERQIATLEQQSSLLALLSADPTLRGFARFLTTALLGVEAGGTTLDELAPRFDAFSTTIEGALAGHPSELSWRNLLDGDARPGEQRRLVLARPILDYGALSPGEAATALLRRTAQELKLDPSHGVRVRITGPVPLADEEFATVAENVGTNMSLTGLAVALILFLALRSPKLIVAVLVTLLSGLIVTSGLGLVLLGRLNLISVAFFALFIGLGVDFGIQFAVRYRAERHADDDVAAALRAAARGVGFSLTLAALSLIAGFLSFLPTDFLGVSELGLIAGLGMFVAFVASFTLLPALIVIFKPAAERAAMGAHSLAGIDHWIARRRLLVLALTAAVVLAGTPFLLRLKFDSNPMDLRSQSVESVATYLDLARRPETSPNTLEILVPSVGAIAGIANRLAALPQVGRVTSLLTFIPDDQAAKLALIADARRQLAPVLSPQRAKPPSDEERVAALRETERALRQPDEGHEGGSGASSAKRLADDLARLASAAPAVRDVTREALLANFGGLVDTVRLAMGAGPISRENLPPDLVASWVAADGRARIEVAPKQDVESDAASERFVAAVQRIAPDATGAPVTIAESGRTILRSFVQAGISSLVAITLILWVAMRRLVDVVLALGPLVVAGILTLETAEIVGLQLNFANIIALPLMFGVGVAFHIYYLIAWRAGTADVLASSLTRAIFFSALTTGTAFGSLWSSSHPGTASMGELLTISLVFTLLAAFVVVPACLGPPRGTASQHGMPPPSPE